MSYGPAALPIRTPITRISILAGHFVSSPRERDKRDIVEEMKERDRGEKGTGMKVKK